MNLADHPELQKYKSSFSSGSVIFSEGDQARDLYILVSGRLDIVKGAKKISEINDPDFFGELSFLLGTVRIASVIAAEDSSILCFPSDDVNTLWKKFPEFGEHMAKILARRLHDTTNIAQGFREFCDQMPDAVIMTDTEQRVLSWNQAAEDLYGRKWEHMRDKPIEDIYDNQAAFHQFMAALSEHGSVSPKTMKINHPEKDWFFVSTSTTLLKDPYGNIQGYLFLGRDATSQYQLAIKHQQFKSWLTPLVLIITLLTGWMLWQNISSSENFGDITSGKSPSFHSSLNDSTRLLELSLAPLLATENIKAVSLVLDEYFQKYQPFLIGINGIMILDREKNIAVVNAPHHPGMSDLIGKKYDGSRHSGNNSDSEKGLMIYLAERPEMMGGRSIEAMVQINDFTKTTQGWIILRLDPETLEKKYSLNVNNIASSR